MSGDDGFDDLLAAITDAAEATGATVGPVIQVTPDMQAAAARRLADQDQAIDDLSGVVPRALVEFNPRSRRNGNAWDDRADKLWLLTPDELAIVPDGTVLVSISGTTATKGVDYIDDDTRAGLLAYGLLSSQLPPAPSGVES